MAWAFMAGTSDRLEEANSAQSKLQTAPIYLLSVIFIYTGPRSQNETGRERKEQF